MQDFACSRLVICSKNGPVKPRNPQGAMSFRKRLENSNLLAAVLSSTLAGYLRLCFATTRWQPRGVDQLLSDLDKGPVIVILWHCRLMIAPLAWPRRTRGIFTLRDPSPAGRLSAETQRRLGLAPIKMHPAESNFAASRRVLKKIHQGHSLGLTADGPLGPTRKAKQAPLEWARASGRPVYLFSWSARRTVQLNTWDGLVLPLPFTRGLYEFRRWDTFVPRKLTTEDYPPLQDDLSDALDQVARDLDQQTGAVLN